MKQIMIVSLLTLSSLCYAAQEGENSLTESMAALTFKNENPEVITKFLSYPIASLTLSELNAIGKIIEYNPTVFQNHDGVTALYSAANNQENIKINYLLDGGADKAYNNDGLTAINIASHSQHITLQSLQCLLANGVKINALNQNNQTPYAYALKNNLALAALLIKKAITDKTTV